MTFGPHHYMPVLKVKRGEKAALQAISETFLPRITPLLEIVERKDKGVREHLNTAFKGLASSVRPYQRCFIDTRELAPDGTSAAAEVFQMATTEGIEFTPVTGISRTADVEAVMNNRSNGIGLRLTRSEFEGGNLVPDLLAFMEHHALDAGEIDLIVDLGDVSDFVFHGVSALTHAFLAELPNHRDWRTITLSACGFPPGIGRVGRNSHALLDRVDWVSWRDSLHARRADLPRLPAYSDYAIQNTAGVEGFDPQYMPVSASVRYASSDEWLIIKGESNKITPLKEQFPRLAELLVRGGLRSHFHGEDHCTGCESVMASANGADRLGSSDVWRRLGTIHHITSVIEQLDALPWS